MGEGGAEVRFPETDAVIEKDSLTALDGKTDYSAVAPPRREPRRRIYQSQADREREEAEQKLLEEETKNASS